MIQLLAQEIKKCVLSIENFSFGEESNNHENI